MSTVVDFHSHILPKVDDGSDSVEESIGILRMEESHGIRHVIATPHFYAHYDSPQAFLERREQAYLRLREEMKDHPGLPQVSLGAEVYYFRGISDSDVLPELTMAGRPYIMIEMPQPPWTESMYRDLEGIWEKHGIVPIIAHVDRYIRPFKTYKIPERLEKLPVLVQANASFFLEPGTSWMALRMLKKNQIHLLGSDCHNLRSRKPNLGGALQLIEKRLGAAAIQRIQEYEAQVLSDE